MAGLFDIFSNDNAEQAAADRNKGLQTGYDALSGLYGQGRDALTSNVATTAGQGRDALTAAYGQGRDALTAGYGAAGGLYKDLLTSYAPGAQAYGDATGANGADGYTRAKTNFQTDPGYGFQMDQGQQALNRAHAAAGNLNSGNADTDTLKFSQGLADQSYGSYVSRLLPYFQGQQTATAGAAANDTGYGGAVNQSYDAQGNAINQSYGTQGQTIGTGLNTSYQGQGTAANANLTGQGASTAAADMNNYNISQNMWNGIGKAVNVGSSLFGAFA